MNLLTVLPYAALAGLAVASVGQGFKIASLKDQLQASQKVVALREDTILTQKTALDQKDAAIREQSASIALWKQTADANRKDYEDAMRTARSNAASLQSTAATLLSLQAPEGELAQCRAARDLLEKELTE